MGCSCPIHQNHAKARGIDAQHLSSKDLVFGEGEKLGDFEENPRSTGV